MDTDSTARSGAQTQNWAGAAVYSDRTLRLYDFLVLTLSNRWAWKCPTPRQLEFFEENWSNNHLDIGVGSGYYTSACHYPDTPQRLALMDLNPACLDYAAQRMAGTGVVPTCHQADILAPITWDAPRFTTVSIFYLLHCLPGTMADKEIVFANAAALLEPDGEVFGTTILGRGGSPNAAARKLMQVYNDRGIFSNRDDDADTLRQAMEAHFTNCDILIIGEVALFYGMLPESPDSNMS